MCLQSMIEEILLKKDGHDLGDTKHRAAKLPFLTRQKRVVDDKKPADAGVRCGPTPELNHGENTIFEDDNFISNDDL
jgi:hypothetical protein